MTETAAKPDPDIGSIASALVEARRTARALAVYPGALPTSLEAGYAIQSAGMAAHGGAIAGWKVGRIWPPFDAQFGSDRLAGPVFAAGVVIARGASASTMPVFEGGFGAVEAEFIFRLGDVPHGQARFSLAEAAATIAGVHVGIEIASSPLPTINDLGPAVTVSDFGNNHGLIVGPEIADWADVGIDRWRISVLIDGAVVGTGVAADFPDGTLGSVRFLLELMALRRISVPPGTLVSTGAITGVHAIAAGQSVAVHFGDRHSLFCRVTRAISFMDK